MGSSGAGKTLEMSAPGLGAEDLLARGRGRWTRKQDVQPSGTTLEHVQVLAARSDRERALLIVSECGVWKRKQRDDPPDT